MINWYDVIVVILMSAPTGVLKWQELKMVIGRQSEQTKTMS